MLQIERKTLAADDAVSSPLQFEPTCVTKMVQSYEKGLAQALYSCIRAVWLGGAVELCRKVHQPWRSVSIHGSLLFSWKAISGNLSQCHIPFTH